MPHNMQSGRIYPAPIDLASSEACVMNSFKTEASAVHSNAGAATSVTHQCLRDSAVWNLRACSRSIGRAKSYTQKPCLQGSDTITGLAKW
jgi:hypothetical protein